MATAMAPNDDIPVRSRGARRAAHGQRRDAAAAGPELPDDQAAMFADSKELVEGRPRTPARLRHRAWQATRKVEDVMLTDEELAAERRRLRTVREEAEAAEDRAIEAERAKWRHLPPSRAPRGTPTHHMTEEQIFQADREEGRA
ncbi:MAG: hypothetical protein ACK55I_45550 [bacterium]